MFHRSRAMQLHYLFKGSRCNGQLFTTIRAQLWYSCTTVLNQHKSYTEQFTDILQRIKEVKQKTQISSVDAYKPRYIYKGRLKKNTKWSPISEADLLLKQTAEDNVDVGPLRKFCMLLGYSGADYMGSQRLWNTYDNTIEEVLLKAMLESNWITPLVYRYPHRISFESASRTDKGVSAARQCFSFMAPVEKATNIAELNQILPKDIRILDIRRVSKNFSSRTSAMARTYSYTLPTIAFCPHNEQTAQQEYRITSNQLSLVNDVLQYYKGVHNFHNFTVDVAPTDQSAFRLMEHLECGNVFVVDGVEFAVIRIRGASFMMHQIRKMIGLLLAVVRHNVDEQVFERTLSKNKVDIPTAPGLGLVLDQVHYDYYNDMMSKKLNSREGLIWSGADEEIEHYRQQFIQPVIIQKEMAEKSMVNWIDNLSHYSYEIESND